jgi:hypothetical protein
MKTLFTAKKYLSIALAVAALTTVGTGSGFAQALSHDGSLLPHYFDKDGELKWGSWGETAPAAGAPAVHRQAVRTTHPLIQDAQKRTHTRVQ